MSQLNGLDGRDVVCRELDLSESELNQNCPLLLELIRRGRDKHGEVRESTNQEHLSICTVFSTCLTLISVLSLSSQGDRSGHVSKVSSQ